MFDIVPVPVLDDNYVWLGHDGRRAFVVDPGEAAPVERALAGLRLELVAILVTHHHADHVGGVATLCEAWRCPVYGPASVADVDRGVRDGGFVTVDALELTFEVLAVPGHTLDHLAYHAGDVLFCGDTLFACGCGKLFEGTPAQMQASLARLKRLDGTTRVYCTHEYTLANEHFALAVEPANDALVARHARDRARRERALPTLPSTIALECSTNPFLRWDEPGVIAQALVHGATDGSPIEVFAAIRRWKDIFCAPTPVG